MDTPLTLVRTIQSYDSIRAIAASSAAHDAGGTTSMDWIRRSSGRGGGVPAAIQPPARAGASR